MRIECVSYVVVWEQNAPRFGWHRHAEMGTFSHVRSSFQQAHFFHTVVLLMPSHPSSFSTTPMLQNCCAVMGVAAEIQNRDGDSISRNVSE
jgi:hypothetical protein